LKPDLFEFIDNARQRRSAKFRNQLTIFIICLVLSLFIWILVRLSKDYYYSLDYHLTYTNLPSHLKLTGISDSVIIVKIKVQGFDFITERFLTTREQKYDVSLKNLHMRYTENKARGYLMTNRIGKEIVEQSSFTSDVFFVIPDTLFFDFEKPEQLPVSRLQPASHPDVAAKVSDSVRLVNDSARKHGNAPIHSQKH
jgi:hypothetical protein